VRYSIEAGMFGPGVRLGLAALFGLALAVGGEVIRRTGYRVPLEGLAGAYVPGVLTAAGTFTLFGTVYAAHGVYGFIGPGPAFCLMGVIGIGTIALALVHGQALAGVGLLGSMVTPILVSSQSPNAWTLFGYLAIVLVANTAVARLRGWALLAAAGFAGAGLWQLLYLIPGQPVELGVVAFIDAAMLASLAVIWLRQRPASNAVPASALDWPSIVLAVFMAAAAVRLLLGPDLQAAGGATVGAAILVAMLLVALYRPPAVPLLHAAGAASVLVYAGTTLTGVVLLDFPGGTVALDAEPAFPVPATLRPAGTVLALAFLIAGLRHGGRIEADAPVRAASWVGWCALVPVSVLFSLWTSSAISTAISSMPPLRCISRQPDCRCRDPRQKRKTAARRRPGGLAGAGRRRRCFDADAAHGVRIALDDHACRCCRYRAGPGHEDPPLSDARLAGGRRGDRDGLPGRLRSDDRRRILARPHAGVQRAPARLRHSRPCLRARRLATGAHHRWPAAAGMEAAAALFRCSHWRFGAMPCMAA